MFVRATSPVKNRTDISNKMKIIFSRHVCFIFVILLLRTCVSSVSVNTINGKTNSTKNETNSVVITNSISYEVTAESYLDDRIHFVLNEESEADEEEEEPEVVHGCPVNHTRPCVPKCCDLHQSFSLENKSICVDSEDQFLPNFKDCPNYTSETNSLSAEDKFEYFIGNPCIRGKYLLDEEAYPEDRHFIYSNGTLWYSNRFYSMADYCLESIDGVTRTFVCFDAGDNRRFKFQHILYPTGLLLSIPFLIATAVIYTAIDRFRDLQGKALACHVTCLAIGYFFLALVQLASDQLNEEVCIAAAFIIQFFFVACFFWLNVLSYDTWRNTQNDFRTIYKTTSRSEKMKFIFYSLYAWYGPCILSIVSLVMDLEPAIPESFLKPKFGAQSCWFNSDAAALPYFYGPVGILILVNIVFFILSARKIYIEQRKYTDMMRNSTNSDFSKESSSKLKGSIETLKQCIYLFMIMGINWAAEIISWAAGGSDIIWLVTDIFNALQGVIIFYLFVIKPPKIKNEVVKILRHSWEKIRRCDLHYEVTEERHSNHWHANIRSEDEEEDEYETTFNRENSEYIKVPNGDSNDS